MRRLTIWACVGLVCVLGISGIRAQETAPAGSAAAASVPRLIKFSGELRDLAGKPLTGVADAHFAIYRAQQDAAPIWEETQTLQLDEQGRYSVLLGAVQAEGLPVELFTSGEARWLGVAAGKLPEQPRVLMVSVPYALKAADAETLGGKPASAYALTSSSGTAPLAVALPASSTTAASLTNMTGTQPKAAVSAGATEFNDTTTDQVVKVFQNGSGLGLYALARNNSAILGKVLGTTGMTFGVRGVTPSTSGAGVYGQSTATTGDAYGVRGQSVSGAGGGVLGINTSPTGVAYGVLGITDSADGAALAARARATTGAALGVQAITYSPNSTAVFAQAAAASGPTTGVLARVNSGSGTALVADNARGGKILSARVGDVEKLSVSGNGNVVASGNVTAASFWGSGAGLWGVSAVTAATAANATNAATANSANNLGGVPAASYARRDATNTFSGDQTVNGNLTVNGTVTGTQFHGDGSGLTVSGAALAAVLARLETLENIVLPPRPTGAHLFSKAFGTAVAYGTTEAEGGSGVAVDKNGNIFVTGGIWGPVDFGGGPVACCGGAGEPGAFLAKFSGVDGSHLWSKAFVAGGAGWCGGAGVAVDANGNVVVTGDFGGGPVDFGGGPLTTMSYSAFVAKYSGVDGSHIWSKAFSGPAGNAASAVAVDAAGNVLVAASFQGTVDLGGGPVAAPGQTALVVGKLSGADGSHLWSKGFGGQDRENQVTASGIATDATNNVIVAGRLYGFGTVDFGGGPLIPPAEFGGGAFVAKFSGADGSHVWSKGFPGSTWFVFDAGVDAAGNALVTGSFQGTLDLGGGPLTGVSWHIYVAKFSGADGTHLWSKAFGGGPSAECYVRALAVDANGNVLITGEFGEAPVDLGGGPLTFPDDAAFVAKYSGADGSHIWSKGFGGTTRGNTATALSVAVDPSANVLVTGDFGGTVDFGGGPLTSVPKPDGEPSADIFLLKLHP